MQPFCRAYLEPSAQRGVELIGLTDHNDVSWVDPMRQAARSLGMEVLPGFETESKEGIHVLCLFDPSTPVDHLNECFVDLGMPAAQRTSKSTSRHGFTALIDCVQGSWGGVCVAAHVSSNKGLCRVLTGSARIKAWQHQRLLAAQISPADLAKGSPFWTQPDYARTPQVALIVASDSRDPATIGLPQQWIKFDELTIDGLRQAFLDSESRLSYTDPSEHQRGGRVRSAHWEGGLLGGTEMAFNDALTCLIGGRGSGKSSAIETIRYALGLDEDGARGEERRDLRGAVFPPPSKLTLRIWSETLQGEYQIERTAPSQPVVRRMLGDQPGDVEAGVRPSALVAPMFVGQRELAEIAVRRDALLDLLDRAGGAALGQRRETLLHAREALGANSAEIRTRRKELLELESRLAELPSLEHQSRQFAALGVSELLERGKKLQAERSYIDRTRQSIASRIDQIQQLASDPLERVLPPVPASALEPELLQAITRAAQAAAAADSRALDELLAELRRHLGLTDDAIGRWKAAAAAHEDKINDDLRKADPTRGIVNSETVLGVERRIQELRPDRAKRDEVASQVTVLEAKRTSELVPNLIDARRRLFEARVECASTLTKSVAGRVAVSVRFESERDSLRQWLRAGRQGSLRMELQQLSRRDDASPVALAQAFRGGVASLQKLGLTPSQAEKLLAERDSDALLDLEQLDLADAAHLELDVSPDGSRAMKALDELSPGQRNTALLLLLLHEREDPLFLDQPEDDLDNRFVFEDVVQLLRSIKRERQFVIATHNANIPVAGDAEQIVVLEALGPSKAQVAANGSIDRDEVRSQAERILEGGREAFERRRAKYGFDGAP